MKRKTLLFVLILFTLCLLIPTSSYAKVELNQTKKTLVVKEKYRLKVTGTEEKVRFKSSNSKVVTVSSSGTLKAKKKGSATITATVGGEKITCKVKVIKPDVDASTVVFNSEKRGLSIRNKKSFHTITYKSTNKKIVTVSKNGTLKGIKNGSCYVTITFNKAYTHTIRVKVTNAVTSSTISIMKGTDKKLVPPYYKNISTGSFRVLFPDKGYVKDGIYYSTNFGYNTVVYKNGIYQHTFYIKNYCWEAHRGYHAVEPENTLEAMTAAKKAGASAVEIDIRATEDGDFVIMHDSTLNRTTNLKGSVKYKTVAQLNKSGVITKNGKKYKVPTLKEALIHCKKLKLNVAIEVKTFPSENYAYSKKHLVNRLRSLVKLYGNENTSLLFTKEGTAKDYLKYCDSSIPCRIRNDSYNKYSGLRKIAKKYSFFMSTTDYSKRFYNELMLTQNDPIR